MPDKVKAVWVRLWQDIYAYKWAVAGFAAYNIAVRFLFEAFCPMLILTGLPCPGCGTTRAVLCIISGQFERAFHLNPSAFLWIAFALYCFIWRYILGRKIKAFLPVLAALCLIMIGVYIYRMAVEFPGYPPMTFYRNNLLGKYVPFYNDVLHKLFQT